LPAAQRSAWQRKNTCASETGMRGLHTEFFASPDLHELQTYGEYLSAGDPRLSSSAAWG
jgi:hypothetical protein